MEETAHIKQKLPNQEFDYFKMAKILVSRWYWIVASMLLCYLAANIYLWYTPKTYSTSGSLKLEEKPKDLSDIVGTMSPGDKNTSKLQTEIFVIQSTGLIRAAAADLNYPVSFYLEGRVRTHPYELYPEKPLPIRVLKMDSNSNYAGYISFRARNRQSYTLGYEEGGVKVNRSFSFDQPVEVGGTSFRIGYRPDMEKGPPYLFSFNTPESLVSRIRSGLLVGELIKGSMIISLKETDSNPQFAADILNAIMAEYLRYDLTRKRESASQIISFIDKQLDTITGKVKQSEAAIEDFKKKAGLLDIPTAAQTQNSRLSNGESQSALLTTALDGLQTARHIVAASKSDGGLNFTLDADFGEATNTLLVTYNKLVNDKISWSNTYRENSPMLSEINDQLRNTKAAILESIDLAIERVRERLKLLNAQTQTADQKIAVLPESERGLVSLNRDFEINEKVYNLLKEKKLDAQISRSSLSAGAAVVEKAKPNLIPVAPDERGIRKTSVAAGLLIGLGLIVLIRVLNPYIYDKETIESLTPIPIIGVIRKVSQKLDGNGSEILVLSQPRSVFSESVRAVRTNLSFLASEKKNQVICITSEVAGEGKSFVAVNLSATLSLIDRKVILIAADLRRSKLHQTFAVPNDKGLSNYLAHQTTIEDVIVKTGQKNLDFIPSGPVPPNPSELLHSSRMKTLIDNLTARYDFVMIDTAPVGLVSDSIPLIRLSDINIFVIRSGKSKFYSATIPQRIDNEYHLNNSVIILNAFEEDLLHSRYYTTKFTGNNTGSRYYYYSDYSGYESAGYYLDNHKRKWWDPRGWFS